MKWGRRQGLGLLAGCAIAFANYGCSREPEPSPDRPERKPGLDRSEPEPGPDRREPKPDPDPAEVEAASKSFRRIDTENRFFSGPGVSTTGVIRSQKALDDFLATEHLGRHISPKNKAYYSAIRDETIDFPREALCLFCIMYGTFVRKSSLGLTTLTTKTGVRPKRHMTFRLATKLPGGNDRTYPDAIGYDCRPMVVDSSAVDTLSWEVDGVEVYSADLTKPSPALKEDSIFHSRDVERAGRTNR